METQTLTSKETPQGSGIVKLLSAQVLDPTSGTNTNLENAIFALPNAADLGSGTIVAGQSITIGIQYSLFINGQPIRDIVNPSLEGLPPSSQFAFTPPTTFTFQTVLLTLTTSTLTPSNFYVLVVGGISALNGFRYTPATFRLTVQPAPKGKDKEKDKDKETKETKDKEREKTKEKERLDTLAKPKEGREKDTVKENKDFKQENKESKDSKDQESAPKFLKDEKDGVKRESKEIGKDIFKDKEFKDKDKEFKDKDLDGGGGKGKDFSDGGSGDLPLPLEPIAFGTMEQRLSRLESAMGQLRHFISPELRPDLIKGALRAEADYQPVDPTALSQQLQQQATAAKQAKDNKDVEKVQEQ
ncbi:MAG: hypothetical protein HC764_23010 [Pleurocapsa sp. CRU_1_2]|nr:hypothetical protein [Pleurocapsa sp. CRU_1_2]